MELDKIDKHILNILQIDSKITNVALAQKINLSPAATLERVKKLEQHGIITKYVAKIDYAQLGCLVHLIIAVRLHKMTTEHIKMFKLAIEKIGSITTCYQVIGEFDFILMVHSQHISTYQKMVLEKLYLLPIVDHLKTLLVTELLKDKPLYL